MQSSLVVHFLIFVLVSLCYEQLAKPVSVEARKLNSNGASSSFIVELIHRDSPHSPYYNPSKRPNLLGSISGNHKIHLSSIYDSNKDEKNFDRDLIPNGGDYLMKIGIGTPPVEFIGNADTGSDLVWVQCSPCSPCIPQNSSLFDSNKSSTYQAIPCNSQSCTPTDLSVSGCLNDDPYCVYDYSYGDSTESVGYLAKETITFTSADGSSLTAFPNSTFGCGHAQKGSFGIQGNGIFGLGLGPLSLVSQLGPTINYKFSYCLAPLTSGVNSKLKFGADVIGPQVVSTPFITKPPVYTNYYLTLDSITIDGGSPVPVGQDAIIDSGTTLTLLESSVYDRVKTAISGAIGGSPVPDPNNIYDLCYKPQQESGTGGEGYKFSPPDVVFNFKGANVVLKSINTFRQIQDDLVCLAMIPTKQTFIFGNIAQVNFEVGYDLQAKQVSFVPADCSKYA